ncbi:MAG: BC1881 family protein [Clostridia bacterium]|jgi:hypothetical protein|nr:BC1881 family protein [Clostridia bacterium]
MEECSCKLNVFTTEQTDDEDIIRALLQRVPTCQLVAELSKREGVDKVSVPYNDAYNVTVAYMNKTGFGNKEGFGPARILIITD